MKIESEIAGAVADRQGGHLPGRDLIRGALEAGWTALDEYSAKQLLAAYGIPTPTGVVVDSAGQAARAAEAIGTSVVIKAVGPDIQHKSDRGLLALDVRGADAARVAYKRIVDLGGDSVSGVLVEQMMPHERELLVGMRRDEQYGPVVAFGLGGIFTEAMADVAFALAPLDEEDASELIGQVRAHRLLGAVRGLPRVDRAELGRVLRAVGQLAFDHPEISEVDINPLLVSGGSLVAADALVILNNGRELASTTCRERPNLDVVFSPKSVAIIGASGDPTKWGGSLMKNLTEDGYEGQIYPINPRGGECFGIPALASLDEMPGKPDLAVVALGAAQATPLVAECGRLGIPAAMVIAAGFAEAGSEGQALENGLVAAATDGHVTLIGPNCMGVISNSSHVNAVGFITLRLLAGPVSVVSHSGNIGTQLLMACERRGVGVEKFISLGNQALTDANDVLEHLATDPQTGVVVMYLEAIGDGRRFFDVARATTLEKPIVITRGGMTAYGRRAASSHTGAMAGSAEIFSAAARQAGVIVSDCPDESLDVASCLAYLPLPRGRRVAVVTLGGGWGVLAADALARNGLLLADLPDDVVGAIDEMLPPFWSHGNPIDLVTTVQGGVPQRAIELVAGCDAVDAVIALALVGSPSSGRAGQGEAGGVAAGELNAQELEFLRFIAEVMEKTGKPIITVPLTPVTRSAFTGFGQYAPVLIDSPLEAVRALSRMVWYADYRERRRVGSDAKDFVR